MSKRAYTEVSVLKMFEDIPNLSQQAVMEAIVGGRSISNSITMSSLQGPYRALERMNRYGRSGNYDYGLAEVTTSIDSPIYGDVAWVEYLKTQYTLEDTEEEKDYITIDSFSHLLVGDTSNRTARVAFSEQTNPIVSPNTFAYYVHEETYTEIWANDGVEDYLHVVVPVDVLTHNEHYVEFTIRRLTPELTGYTESILGTYVWVYNESSNIIPALHILDVTPISESIYPTIPIRIDGQDYAEEGTGLETSADIKKMLGYLSIDPLDIIDGIKDNPDEGDIDDVFIGFGISITGEDEYNIAGLAHTFSRLYIFNPLTESLFTSTNTRQSLTIEEAGFKNTISYNFIRSEILVGSPGYTRSFTSGDPITVCVPNPIFADWGVTGPNTICTVIGSSNEYVFTRPIVGSNTYERITVQGLTSKHTMIVPGFGERVTQFEGDEDGLVVPLLREVLTSIPRRLRDDLIFGSLHLYVYSYQIIKLKWYQTGIFKVLISVIGITLAVFTYGSSLAAAFSVSTVAGALAIAQILAVTLLVDYAVQWLVQEVGGTLAVILAIATSLVTANFSTMSVTINTSWYSLFSSAVKVYGTYINVELEKVTEEQAAFESEYESRQEQIDAATDLLDWGTTIDLLDLGEYRSLPNVYVNEEPKEFYARTTEVVDLPEISNNMVTLYYEAQLELPKVSPFTMNFQNSRGI